MSESKPKQVAWQFPLAWPDVARNRRILGTLAAVFGGLYLLIAILVHSGWESALRLDARIASWASRVTSEHERYADLVESITHVGDSLIVVMVAGLVSLALWGHRLWRQFWFLFVTLGVGFLGAYVMKFVVDRPRPPTEYGLLEFSPSFPSGHTTGSALLWTGLLLIALPWEPRTRWPWMTFFAVTLALMIAASRVLLAAHYLSDVVAALCWSVAWVSLSLLVVQPWREIDVIRSRVGLAAD